MGGRSESLDWMIDIEEQLTSAAVRGDTTALSALLKRHDSELHGRIAPKIGRLYRGFFDADDVLQVTYVEAFLRIEQFMSDRPGGILAWLSQAAENNLRDAIRLLNREKRPRPGDRITAAPGGDSHSTLLGNLVGSGTTPSRGAAASETELIIERALSDLPPDYAKVVRLYDLEGRPIGEVAQVMNRSQGAVHMLRSRAHDRLREILGEAGKFFSDCA